MAEGKSNGAVARALSISDGTVEKCIASVFSKLDHAEEGDSEGGSVLVYLREGRSRPGLLIVYGSMVPLEQ